MLVRVQFRLLCPSQADANQVQSAINTKLSTKLVQTVHQPATVLFLTLPASWTVIGDVSFLLRLDADDVFTDVQSKWTSGGLKNRITAGSRATLHVCAHAENEEPPWQNCKQIDYVFASKVG